MRGGDIVFVSSPTWLGKAIRFLTRGGGEGPTKVSHVGIVIEAAGPDFALVEANRAGVQYHYSTECRWSKSSVAIYTCNALTDAQRAAVVAKALEYKDRKYGFWKLIPHAADGLLGGRYVFRRLLFLKQYPICSWVAAWAYQEAGVRFGVHPNAATPDDIWDWVTAAPGWQAVRTLSPWLTT